MLLGVCISVSRWCPCSSLTGRGFRWISDPKIIKKTNKDAAFSGVALKYHTASLRSCDSSGTKRNAQSRHEMFYSTCIFDYGRAVLLGWHPSNHSMIQMIPTLTSIDQSEFSWHGMNPLPHPFPTLAPRCLCPLFRPPPWHKRAQEWRLFKRSVISS